MPRPMWKRPRAALVLAFALALGVVLASGADRTAAPARQGTGLERAERATPAGFPLRLATFNVHSGRSAEGVLDLAATAESLLGVDVAALQEVRGSLPWLAGGQSAELAERLERAWLFAPSERRWWHGHFGNALLSNRPARSWSTTPLVNTRGKAYRNALLAELEVGERTLRVLATHVDTRDDRRDQLRELFARFLELAPPAVLLGDLNTPGNDPDLAALLARPDVQDAHGTLDFDLPEERIDWILLRGLVALEAGIIDRGASDHPCLWAVVAPAD